MKAQLRLSVYSQASGRSLLLKSDIVVFSYICTPVDANKDKELMTQGFLQCQCNKHRLFSSAEQCPWSL